MVKSPKRFGGLLVVGIIVGLTFLFMKTKSIYAYAFSVDGKRVEDTVILKVSSAHTAGVFIKNDTDKYQYVNLTTHLEPDIGLNWNWGKYMEPKSTEHIITVNDIVVPNLPGVYKVSCKLTWRLEREDKFWQGILPGQIIIQ